MAGAKLFTIPSVLNLVKGAKAPSGFAANSFWATDSMGVLTALQMAAGTNITLAIVDGILTITASDLTSTAFVGVLSGGVADGTTDDKAAIQASLNAVTAHSTLFGKQSSTYKIATGLTIPDNVTFDLNGAKLHYTGATSPAITLGNNSRIINGELYGDFVTTTVITNNSGAAGINPNGDNCTIQNMNIHNFSSYGIYATDVNNLTIQNCEITNTGYISVFVQPVSANITGFKLLNCLVDRTGIAANIIKEGGVKIRGNDGTVKTNTGYVISGNTINMPIHPTDLSCIGLEFFSRASNGMITDNYVSGGDECVSFAGSYSNVIKGLFCVNGYSAGFELAGTTTVYNSISDLQIIGGGNVNALSINSGASYSSFSNLIIQGTANLCINLNNGSNNYITFNGGVIYPASGQRGLNASLSNGLTVSGMQFVGNNTATIACVLDKCNRVDLRCSMYDFTSRGVVLTGNVAIDHYWIDILAVNCGVDYGTNFSTGGNLGSHTHIVRVN